MQQFYGMFIKKVIHTRTNHVVTAVQLIMPVLFTIFGLLAVETAPSSTADPALTLDLSPFSGGLTVFYDDGISPLAQETEVANRYSTLISNKGYTALDANGTTNISTYIMDKAAEVGIATFNSKYPIGAYLNGDVWTAYFNGQPFHTPGISLAYLMDAIFKYSKNSNDYSITTINYPFKLSIDEDDRANFFTYTGTAFSLSFQIVFGMAFLTATFIIFLIKERSSGSKHLQKVSGVGSFAFWISNFVWDFINYLTPVVLIIIVFAAFQADAYVEDGRLGVVFLIFLLYGWSFLPLTYNVSFLFSTAASGMVAMTMLNIIVGNYTIISIYFKLKC